MPASFTVGNDRYKIESLMFSGGKERITLNGTKVYEGSVVPASPATFSADGRDYMLAKEGKNYRIRVSGGGETATEGVYNLAGIEVSDTEGQKAASAHGICVLTGVVCGVAFMVVGNLLTGVIPGGAIGGGLGAGLGGALGGVVGKSLFVKE